MSSALQMWQGELRRRLKVKRAIVAILTGSLQRSLLHWRVSGHPGQIRTKC